MDFFGKGQPLSRKGLVSALDLLGMNPNDAAYIWTVIEVETQGFGFRPERRPQMLFERHKFRKFTGGVFDDEAPDVSGPQGGYGSIAEQYNRLEKALALCDKAGLGVEPALKSASWGMGQVMGFNHDVVGFGSAVALVEAMMTGEDAQLAAMAKFLVANGLAKKLLKHDWAGFARVYNGENYAQNQYDIKLSRQYQRFANGSLPSLEVRTAQAALLYLGYSPGKIDGILGNRTRGALANFRIAASLPASDDLEGVTYKVLCEKAAIDP